MLEDRVSQCADATFDAKQTKCGIFTCAPLCGRRTARGISESVFAFSPGAICSECTLSPPRSLRDWLHERERECAPRRYTIYFSRQPPMACDDALILFIYSLFAANPRTAFAFSFIAPRKQFYFNISDLRRDARGSMPRIVEKWGSGCLTESLLDARRPEVKWLGSHQWRSLFRCYRVERAS